MAYTVSVMSGQHATISSTSGAKTVRVYSITVTGQTVYPGIPITVKSERDGQDVKAKVEATATVANSNVTIEIKKTVGTADSGTLWSGRASGDSASSVTISKITLESVAGSDLTNVSVKEVTGGADASVPASNETVKGYTCYPENGYYISGLSSGSAANSVIDTLWNTTWDGGECYYAEYYKNTTTHALLKLCILGGIPTVRYYGKNATSTSWQKIDTEANFSTNLRNLKTTGDLSGITGGSNATNESTNYNTDYNAIWLSPVWLPLIVQGLSVGSLGSIFPNLIPKTAHANAFWKPP